MSNAIWIGVDLGESTFAAALTVPDLNPRQWVELPWREFPMTRSGVHDFCKWARKALRKEPLAGICAEALYPLAWKWMEWLNERLAPLSIVNPRFPKDFARTVGVRDKTDRVDACMLAFYGRHTAPRPTPLPAHKQRTLHELSRLHDAKQGDMQTAKNRLRNATLTPLVLDEMQCEVVRLERALKLIQEEMSRLVDSDEQMKQDCKRLQTIPGIGLLTALRILAELGDLRQYTRTELSALAALYPRQYQSGTSVYRQPRLPKSGNLHLRKALYFPGMVAARHCPTLATFAARLRTKGLTPNAVICAVMRKLLLLMRALLRTQSDYNPKFDTNPAAA